MVGQTRENIVVNLDLISSMFLGKLAKASERMRVVQARTIAAQRRSEMQAKRLAAAQSALAKRQQFFAQWSDKLGVNTGRVSKIMQHQGIVFDKMGNITDHAGRSVENLNSQMRKGEAATRGFKMQWLGVMFAGMAVQRIFGGIIGAQMQLFGITELFSSMWTVIMLPIMEALLPIFIKIAEWMMNLSDTSKKVIGTFILLGLVFGTILAVVGALALAYNSISEVLEDILPLDLLSNFQILGFSLGDSLTVLKKFLIKGGLLAGIFAAFGLAVKSVSAATDENSEAQEGFMSKIKGVMSRSTGFVSGLGEMFINVGSKTEKVIGDIMGFMDGLGLSVDNIGERISTAMNTTWEDNKSIIRVAMTWIEDRIKSGFEKVWTWLQGKMPDWMVVAIEKSWGAMVDWLENIRNAQSIGDAIFATVRLISVWGEIGVFIGGEMLKGIVRKLSFGILPLVKLPELNLNVGLPTDIIPNAGSFQGAGTNNSSGKNVTIVQNNTTNIQVADIREFEDLIREERLKGTDDIRRAIVG